MLSDSSFSTLPPPVKTKFWQGVISVTDGPKYFPYAFKKSDFTVYQKIFYVIHFFFFFFFFEGIIHL